MGGITPPHSSMIKSIEISNFRCFGRAEIKGLHRVNVIVGPNGSGKTALLESLFLASGGSPELALRLRNFRGMGTTVEVPSEGMETIWKNLFHQFDQSRPVTVSLQASHQKSRRLTISRGDSELMDLPLVPTKGFRFDRDAKQAAVRSAIEFVWRDAFGNEFRSKPIIADDKLSFQQAPSPNKVVFVPSNFRLSPEEAAKRLSSLSRRNEAADLVSVLSSVYPDIEDISVENSDGNWEVFVQVRYLNERIPMALHSAGASRLIAMMLAVTTVPGGLALIDEVENGFYYQRLPEIWRVLHTLAETFDAQLFVSTHSREALHALTPLFAEHADSFALLNVDSTGGSTRITVSAGEIMASAIQSGFEVR
jgi:predicted ATPase